MNFSESRPGIAMKMRSLLHRTCAVFSVLAFASAFNTQAAGPVPFEQYLYKGKVTPSYGPASSTEQSQILSILQRAQLAERMANVAQNSLRLRQNLGVSFEACGTPNAFYSRQRSSIIICLELIQLVAKQAKDDTDFAMTQDRSHFSELIDGTMWGVFFHELGHAVIDIDRVPITGREEDVADQFMVYYAITFVEPNNVPVVFPTAWFFQTLSRTQNLHEADGEAIKRLLADEHSLDEQRIYNLACWSVGADETKGIPTARFVGLPNERLRRCGDEYSRLQSGIAARFTKYFRIPR